MKLSTENTTKTASSTRTEFFSRSSQLQPITAVGVKTSFLGSGAVSDKPAASVFKVDASYLHDGGNRLPLNVRTRILDYTATHFRQISPLHNLQSCYDTL